MRFGLGHDIKDAQPQNIAWAPPQGGSGPNYPNM
ncbi:4Fe-4S dicluster domain-containing protein [Aeromonas sp. QDB69]